MKIFLVIVLIIILVILGVIIWFAFFAEGSLPDYICNTGNNFLDTLCTLYNSINYNNTPIGSYCTLPYNCQGWSLNPLGLVDCCNSTCVRKDLPGEWCHVYCLFHPSACNPAVGTRDLSGIPTLCPPSQKLCGYNCIPQNSPCTLDAQCLQDSDCQNGQSCCNSICVQKEHPQQTCDNLCSRQPGLCIPPTNN